MFGYWRILLQKLAVTDDAIQRIHLGVGVLSRDPDARYAFSRGIAVYRTAASRQKRPFHNRALRLRIMHLSGAPPRPPLDHYLKPSSGTEPGRLA